MERPDGRRPDQLRPVRLTINPLAYAEGSALIEMGTTQVLCAATVEETVPPWMRGQGKGWVTAEYSLLPRATNTRTRRERNGAGGRTMEIQRLVGRSLRAAVDLSALGERSITVDCDVLQADGGTRTAAITGAYVALALAVRWLEHRVSFTTAPLRQLVAAVSVGVVAGTPVLDLSYAEDSAADVDFNVVQTEAGDFVELQGTAEGQTFSRHALGQLLDLAGIGIAELLEKQRQALAVL